MFQKMTCQVQPRYGTEIFTIFGIFCTSGKEDLSYEFSYQVGNLSRKMLYNGRDFQYYFNLPAGDPGNGYQVTIFTQVTNSYGSQTRPCPLNVTVHPVISRNTSNALPEFEVFQEGLRNLTVLVLIGNHIEIRNYIVLLTTILNQLFTEHETTTSAQQLQIRNKLIYIVQSLPFNNQDELTDIVLMVKDLLDAKNQVIPASVVLIFKFIKSLLKERAGKIPLKRTLAENLIILLSTVIEVSFKWPGMKYIFIDGMDSISNVMLKHITLNHEQPYKLSTDFLELQTSIHENCQNYIQTIGSLTVHLPKFLDASSCRIQNYSTLTCYISQLMYFKGKEYFWITMPSELDNGIKSLNLFDCRSKRKLNRNVLAPVTLEIDNRKTQNTMLNKNSFSLFRDKINFHQFNTTSDAKHSALRIIITFHDPGSRTFPVLLLIRYSKKPTPLDFNLKQVHSMEEHSTQIFIPADSLKDSGFVYLALMDADYKRHPKNNYILKILQYTVDIQWTQCLSWRNNQWNSEDCSTQKGSTTTMLVCSCTRLGLYTTASRRVLSYFEKEDVSQFISTTRNPIPGIIVVIAIIFYILLMIFGKVKDQHEDQKNAFVFLQDNSQNQDQQQYSIMVDVGFRSRPKSTAKVYIILHGEDGVSETQELYCPERPLFERNSRNVFILSVPDSLGPLWKIHIWHNNSGHSPSLYLSHVIIKDLKARTSCFFYAECWLAVDEGDGNVERELTCTGHRLGFRRLFYCKFTQYLEDFHSWGSVFSRPSYSWFSHTQRITTCFVLSLGYMCFNIILLHWKDDQYTAENGLIDISATSLISGFQSTMAVYPVALILSLLFRYTKKVNKHLREDHSKIKASNMNCHEGHQHYMQEADTILQSSLAWQHFQYWAYDTWKKKYQRDFSNSSIYSSGSRRKHKSGYPSPNLSSTGFEVCCCNISHCNTPGLKNMKDCSKGPCLQQSSDLGLFDISFLNEYKVLPSWCVYVAWSLCAAFSVGFGIVTVVIGTRVSTTKCVLWLHAVFFSMIYCIFIVQPFLILLLALFVAWRNKERTDFFVDALSEDVKYIAGEQYLQLTPPSPESSHETSNFETILAARKRARYLRLARPPTRSQLRIARDKVKRKTVIKKILREFTAYITMTSVFVFITFGKYSNNEYLLNQAVRKEFIRNPVQLFNEITAEDQWWNWSFNVLLDGLYWNNSHDDMSSNREVGPVQGNFFLTGAPIIRKFKSTHNQIISYFTHGSPFFTSSYKLSKEKKYKPHTQRTRKTLDQKYYQCGKIQCYGDQGSVISLGKIRTEAHSALLKMKNERWIEKGTSAIAVQFVLYNSPANLFTMISLLVEIPASGGIVTSSAIESLRIYRITRLMDYFIMVFEMIFLSMVLVSFCIQLSTVIQKSIKSYSQDIWNYLEVSIILLSLCYFISQFYYFMFVLDLVDHLQRGFFRPFINFSLAADYEKWIRSLHGIILFLMIFKLIKMLHSYRMMAPCIAKFNLSCSNSASAMLTGIVFMLCYSSVGHVLIPCHHHPSISVLQSIKATFTQFLRIYGLKHIHFLNVRIKFNQTWLAGLYGILFAVLLLLWTGVLKGMLTEAAKYSKKVHRSKHFVTVKEVLSHARGLILSAVYRHKQKSTDTISIAGNACFQNEDVMQHEQLEMGTVTLGRRMFCVAHESDRKQMFLPHEQHLESGEFENICHNLEDFQKRQDNNRANNKCPVKVEQENGLEMAKHTSIEVVHAEQTKGLQCGQTINKVRNQTFCTSNKILHKDWKSLKHLYANGFKALENSTMDILGAKEQKLQDEDTEQQLNYIFQVGHYEMKMENRSGNFCVERTVEGTTQNINMALTANDTPTGGTSKPQFIKQCW